VNAALAIGPLVCSRHRSTTFHASVPIGFGLPVSPTSVTVGPTLVRFGDIDASCLGRIWIAWSWPVSNADESDEIQAVADTIAGSRQGEKGTSCIDRFGANWWQFGTRVGNVVPTSLQ